MKTFNINYSKTYNPCNFDYFKKYSFAQIFSLLIGIIDGDGCSTKDKTKIRTVTITAHKN